MGSFKDSRLFKVCLLSLGSVLTKSINIVTMALLVRILSVHDYATYKQTLLAYNFVVPLLVLGLPQALYYFLPAESNRPRGIVIENLLMLSLMGSLFSLFLLFGGNHLLALRFHNKDLINSLLILIPYPLLMLPASSLTACLMAKGQPNKVVMYNTLSNFTLFLLVVGFSLIWKTAKMALYSNLIWAVIAIYPAIYLMLSSYNQGEWYPKFSSMWFQLKYSLPLGLASMVSSISMSLDKVIVSSMCSTRDFAIYVNGAIEIPIFSVLTNSITVVLLTDMVNLYKTGNYKEAFDLWKRTSIKTAQIIFPIMGFLIVMAPEVIRILFSNKYIDSVLPFKMYLLLLPVRILSWGSIQMAAGKSSWILTRTIVNLILNLGLSILLIQRIGYIGAVISSIIVIYLWNIPYNMITTAKLYKVNLKNFLPYKDLFKIITISAIASMIIMLIGNLLPQIDIVKLVINSFIYLAVIILLMFSFKIITKNQIQFFLQRFLIKKSN